EIVEPASQDWVQPSCDFAECLSRAPMNPPGGKFTTHLGQLFRGDRRQESGVDLLPALVEGHPRTERVPAERERHLIEILATPAVLAIHDLRLIGMEFQPDRDEPAFDRL